MDRRLFSYEDFVLFESDARSLANANCWLTDNVVNFAVSYLYNQSAEQYPRIINSVSVVSATLCELIKYTEETEMDALLQSIGATPQKWLLFLFNDSTEPQIALSGTHWSLVLFNPHCRHFVLFDPMSQSLSSRDAGNVYKFVLKLATSFGCPPSVGDEQKGGQQLLVPSLVHPIMQVSGDCGIFVVEYSRAILEALSRNAHPPICLIFCTDASMLGFSNIVSSFFIVHLFCASYALYLDQIGKFDWSIRHLGCPLSKQNVVGLLNLDTGNIVWRQLIDPNVSSIELSSVDSSTVQVRSESGAGGWHWTFDIHTGLLKSQSKKAVSEKRSTDEDGVIFPLRVDHRSGRVEFEIGEGSKNAVGILASDVPIAELKILKTNSATDDQQNYKIFVSRVDCTLELYELATAGHQKNEQPKLLWRRFESLSEISDVQMVDMPLSEAQAQIETEFNLDESVWLSFLLRIRSQCEQLHRFFLSTAERFVQTLEMFVSGEFRFSALLRQLLDLGPAEGAKTSGKLERDCFNLRKVIVVSTLSGSLYGISNDDGHLLWSLYLGDHFEPYRNRRHFVATAEGRKVPLLVQRGTTFYQWHSQAATVFNVKNSEDSIVLFFNPITGVQVDQLRIPGGLSRLELWPFPNSEQLHPLLLLRNSDPKVAEIWPPFKSNYAPPKSVYLLSVGQEKDALLGHKVELSNDGTARLNEQWRTVLPGDGFEPIYAIVGKSPNEKMHSQGKVLGDRAVLYKYNNPNLVAVLSANPSNSLLRLHLVDSVSGQLVFTGHYSKATPPFHIVHCENWLVISYWNDKARRTEVGVVELFEGLQQTNATVFDSLAAHRINAMAATSTEQGLTSRAVLVALPFGGILEISRRFLDARRPLEMTAELSEEMMIHYIPELPFATEDLINYNQTTLNVRGIRTAPSGLESTSLVFAYGIDLFYTRVTPSGTFDILKDDFDYVFIAGVTFLLCAASVVCKRIWRYQSIQQAWT
uniref:ER membrane protein complex subunit 1 n=1 Tax=Globodera rostochiensis TaxID=31243 RepID=A0A914HVU3_GLORO